MRTHPSSLGQPLSSAVQAIAFGNLFCGHPWPPITTPHDATNTTALGLSETLFSGKCAAVLIAASVSVATESQRSMRLNQASHEPAYIMLPSTRQAERFGSMLMVSNSTSPPSASGTKWIVRVIISCNKGSRTGWRMAGRATCWHKGLT